MKAGISLTFLAKMSKKRPMHTDIGTKQTIHNLDISVNKSRRIEKDNRQPILTIIIRGYAS